MKIVCLDGYTLNPGDLCWDGVKAMGTFELYDRTPKELIIERARDAELVLTNKTPMSADTINSLPKLKYIGVLATGYNIVDVKAAAQHSVIVTNIPAYSTDSVAQLVFALLLELCHHAQRHSDAVHDGEWTGCADFSFSRYPLIELSGKTMGVIGFGRIGQQVAAIASALGMNVIAAKSSKGDMHDSGKIRRAGIPELFKESDVISLHCPLFPDTAGLINSGTLGLMKQTAFLINTSRGGLIVEADLAAALNCGSIAGAGLDVLSTEPPAADNPLLAARNCIITPHIAWATKEARVRLMDVTVENLKAFLAGNPINMV